MSDAGQTFTLEYEEPVEALNLYFADDWVREFRQGEGSMQLPSRLEGAAWR